MDWSYKSDAWETHSQDQDVTDVEESVRGTRSEQRPRRSLPPGRATVVTSLTRMPCTSGAPRLALDHFRCLSDSAFQKKKKKKILHPVLGCVCKIVWIFTYRNEVSGGEKNVFYFVFIFLSIHRLLFFLLFHRQMS
ncbi:hypothetical protein FQA47_014381 [Oryzias melastigma]|uniref:Uncharacterized protein n=1 Tax=Oryzias melastigma TaxID=30732 RepID=A0A834FBE0_ORYME|nr:hypothetical protein FQA47_014381 [Oryzias melastigma]